MGKNQNYKFQQNAAGEGNQNSAGKPVEETTVKTVTEKPVAPATESVQQEKICNFFRDTLKSLTNDFSTGKSVDVGIAGIRVRFFEKELTKKGQVKNAKLSVYMDRPQNDDGNNAKGLRTIELKIDEIDFLRTALNHPLLKNLILAVEKLDKELPKAPKEKRINTKVSTEFFDFSKIVS